METNKKDLSILEIDNERRSEYFKIGIIQDKHISCIYSTQNEKQATTTVDELNIINMMTVAKINISGKESIKRLRDFLNQLEL